MPDALGRARENEERINEENRRVLEPLVEAHLTSYAAAVAELEAIVSRIDAARTVQQSAGQDLSALMPSLLDRAFQGELDADRVSAPERAA